MLRNCLSSWAHFFTPEGKEEKKPSHLLKMMREEIEFTEEDLSDAPNHLPAKPGWFTCCSVREKNSSKQSRKNYFNIYKR